MTPDAESQGLPQGFNPDLAEHPADQEAPARPRPRPESFPVSATIAAERSAYDERHSVQALANRRGDVAIEGVPDGSTVTVETPRVIETWNDYTAAELKAILDEHQIAYAKSAKKQALVALADANLQLGEPEPAAEIQVDPRFLEIQARLEELAPDGEDEDDDAEREALNEELDNLVLPLVGVSEEEWAAFEQKVAALPDAEKAFLTTVLAERAPADDEE